MKNSNKIITLITTLFLGILITGCKTIVTNNSNGTTITNKVIDVGTVTNTINVVVPLAVQIAVGADTNSVTYINAAIVTIDLVASKGDYDPARLEQLLNDIGSEDLKTPEAKAAVQAGLGLYKAFVADSINLNTSKIDYGAVLTAFSNSLKDGLSRPPIVLKK